MAQVVLRPHEPVPYLNGPFVLAKVGNKGWAVAAERKDCDTPMAPDTSVKKLMRLWEMESISTEAVLVAKTVDRLNKLVSKNVIHLKGPCWIVE